MTVYPILYSYYDIVDVIGVADSKILAEEAIYNDVLYRFGGNVSIDVRKFYEILEKVLIED